MRLAMTVFCLVSVFAVGLAQEKSSSQPPASAAYGLPVGAMAPKFVLRDQFDHKQSNQTLKGASGTILLFYRSADW